MHRGSYVAPYAGIHGIYFENRGRDAGHDHAHEHIGFYDEATLLQRRRANSRQRKSKGRETRERSCILWLDGTAWSIALRESSACSGRCTGGCAHVMTLMLFVGTILCSSTSDCSDSRVHEHADISGRQEGPAADNAGVRHPRHNRPSACFTQSRSPTTTTSIFGLKLLLIAAAMINIHGLPLPRSEEPGRPGMRRQRRPPSVRIIAAISL